MRIPDHMPAEQRDQLARAVRLEWVTIAILSVCIAAVGLASGSSQAMRTAFFEDFLSLLPPIAFLVGVRRAAQPRDDHHPFGHHRSVSAAHLVASAALLAMGLLLTVDNVSGLVSGDRPPIGVVHVFGQTFWSGWLMMAVMLATSIPPVILGRMKLKLATPLHDKVLAADADMNKADWTTGLATVAGVAGIGLGLWWADAAAALIVAVGIVHDGLRNLRHATSDLLDARATTLKGDQPHPVIAALGEVALRAPWADDAAVRVRDMGHVFHSEVFVVAKEGFDPCVAEVEALQQELLTADWKARDTVVSVMRALPPGLASAQQG